VQRVSFIGGSRIGWVNATWPFAQLSADARQLRLWSFGTYEFAPEQVVSIEPYGLIPFFASGLRINHNRADYPEKIVFWCLGSRDSVLAQIRDAGFNARGAAAERAPGFALRWSAIILGILVWNALFLTAQTFHTTPNTRQPVLADVLALFVAFGISCAFAYSRNFQRLVLNPGHSIGEVKSFVVLLQLILGGLCVGFGATVLFSPHG